jgi:chloramphenicol-sensitive protein RarD
MPEPSDLDRRGVGLGAAAYVLWGVFPAFFTLLAPAAPAEILAHRVLWTLVFMAVVLAGVRGWGELRSLPRKGWALVTAAATLIAVNWGLFIYAVSVGHVVEVALGYYIGPLVSVLLGVLALRERLRAVQWVALGIAAVAVLVIAIGDGRVPWLGLGLATSFATYGLIKKTVPLPATASLTGEGLVLAPLAAGYLIVLAWSGSGTLTGHGVGHVLLLMSAGPVTAAPLLLFGAAARRIPLSMLGTLQYVAPTLQFLLGVTVYGERMPVERWVGFGLVWLALVIFTGDLLRRRPRRDAPPAADVPGAGLAEQPRSEARRGSTGG